MAHEDLKALYEIDKQYSDTPWEFWEADYGGGWVNQLHKPSWCNDTVYRRKPDAPARITGCVFLRDELAEDARKWRELEAFYQGNGIMDTAKKFLEIIEPKPQLIQGYTAEQWQAIRDGEFLCEFSDADWHLGSVFQVGKLNEISQTGRITFASRTAGARYGYCRPLRTKGVRQPWFGGECPVDDDALVLARHLDDSSTWYKGAAKNVLWGSTLEFIEL